MAKKRPKKGTVAATEEKSDLLKEKDKEIEKLKALLKAERKENQENQVQNATASKPKKGNVAGSYLVKIPLTQHLSDRIASLAGSKGPNLWRTTKFLSHERDLFLATKQIMTEISDCKRYLKGDDEDEINRYVESYKETYGNVICKAINDG